jgi:hypothetical protein
MKQDHVFWLVGVLPHSRDNFTTPEDLNPLCQHVPPLLRGDLGVDTPVVELKVVWHVGIPCSSLQGVDFFVAGLKRSCEMGDMGAGSSELLGSDGGASFHCGGESVGHHACDFAEFISAEADEGFS